MSNRLTSKTAAASPSTGDVLYLDGPTGVRKLDAGYPANAAAAAVAGLPEWAQPGTTPTEGRDALGITGGGVTVPLVLPAMLSANGSVAPMKYGTGAEFGEARQDFAGVTDYIHSWGYHGGSVAPAGDVRNAYTIEHGYKNLPGFDTENYIAWTGPTGVNRRLYQCNTSWGPSVGANKAEGYNRWHFSADYFGIGKGDLGDEPFRMDLTAGSESIIWNYAFQVEGATTLNGPLTLGGASYISAGASAKSPVATPFVMQSTGSVMARIRTESSGDAGMEFARSSSSSEKLLIGAAAGGTVFGTLNNAFAIDWITSSAARSILFRSSVDSGTTRTSRFAVLANGIAIASNSAITSGADANGATNAIFFEGGTAPSGNPTSCGILWYDNSDKVLKTRDTSGRVCSFGNALKTEDPPSGTAATWKLGSAASVTPTSPNRTIHVNIGGVAYYIAAKTTND